MAQAKTRPSSRSSQGARKSQARTGGSSSKSRTSSKTSKSRSSPKSKSRSTKSRSKPRSSSGKSSSPKSNGTARVDSARRAVESTAKGAGQTAREAGQSVGRVASKAKVPLMAGGAALMGAAAGGLAVGAKSRRGKGIAKAIPRRPLVKIPRRPLMKVGTPQIKVKSRDLKHVAKEVGSFGAQVGRVASELQNAHEESNGKRGGKHRSPVEVVLEGLTARR
jgi:hypothetical protein